MGKNLIQQARGTGSPRYKTPSFRFKTDGRLKSLKTDLIDGKIIDLVNCQGHSAPIIKVKYNDGELKLMIAPEGIRVGDVIAAGPGASADAGNILSLADIPEGTFIFNIESQPGDGGKFCRASGNTARLLTKSSQYANVMMPSKKQRKFNVKCRAMVGIIAGGGRHEKPILKAGIMHHKMKAKNKLYPRTGGSKMNAIDHPFGNKRSARKAKQKPVSRFAPPGRKVGKLAAKRTGKRK
ncbi:50S ribosomal protein L2 [Candidatus Woesearchaeota archaeon]|nr:50S ribosomal protein L2 [Candidatus Woesearchaeota archaeon]MBW2993902.1 50S ribosomal protein L2 [Candidatus Woesearchaeota archaeon]